MKFKVAAIGLLTAILVVCCFTSYRLIQEAEKQTAIQAINTKVNITIGDMIADSHENEDIYSGQLTYAHRDLIEYVGNIGVLGGWTPEEYFARYGK